ncbi:fused MFS/spermidine synthase [Archangium violaceum]|uniref:fused MFS/spermidine synthase n=1 Tax=Archangium violaceum TaxID=83451 RepID=UPI00193C174D|nr:fused MFS/spermidine synthase [Archangium violaceum]QRK04940.1 fused MFS/spermidine synthase [Archangium violaceum]
MRQTPAAVLRPLDPPLIPRSGSAPAPGPGIKPWVLRLFFLSGLSGILFEVLWTRIFTFLLGGTTQSVSAVITAFMFGMGVGSYVFGGLVDGRARRPLVLYGLLELGVALSGLVAFYAFQHIESLYAALYSWAPHATVKWLVFLIAFVFISIPATLIGGTLPALVRHAVARAEGVKAALGRLYALNSLGSSAGAILMLGLVWVLGYEVSYHVALVLNCVTGISALVLARREARARHTEAPDPHPDPLPEGEGGEGGISARVLLPAFALSGFCALAYEVIWFRTLDFLLLGKLTTFACVLSVYLLGISLGSLAFSQWRPRGLSDLGLFVRFELLLGLIGLTSLPVLSLISGLGSRPLSIATAFVILFGITFLLGGLFPLAGKLYAGSLRLLGRTVGNLYSANTLGSVLGSFLTGFVLIPWVGTANTLLLTAGLNLLIAAGVAGLELRPVRTRPVAVGVGLAVVALAGWFSADWLTRFYERAGLRPGFHIIAQAESSLQPLLVAEDAHGERVLMGGPFQSGETVPARRQTQRLQAHLPMLVHSSPRRVLEIGYGVGELPRTLHLYEPELLHLAELDEHMIPMAEEYFGALNEKVSRRPNVRVDVMDGRHFLKMSPDQYDVIMSDSMILASEGSLRLYTEEHFREARRHLRPGGVVLAWLPLNAGTTKALVILKTFHEVFPQSLLWLPLGHNTQEAFLIGFRDEARIDWEAWKEKFERVARADLEGFGWGDPALFFASFRAGPERLADIASRIPLVNRDMSPVLDFLPQDPPAEIASTVERLVGHDPGFIFEHLRAGPGNQEALESLRAGVQRIHEADLLFLKGVATLDRFGARPPAEVLENAASLTADFRRALEVYPAHPAASVWTAQVLGLATRVEPPLAPERLRALLEDAVRHNPTDVSSVEALARLALQRGDSDEARKYLARLRVLSPYSRLTREMP